MGYFVVHFIRNQEKRGKCQEPDQVLLQSVTQIQNMLKHVFANKYRICKTEAVLDYQEHQEISVNMSYEVQDVSNKV